MGAFQSALNDSLDKAIDYFKKWNAAETEKTLQILDHIKPFLGDFTTEFQQDTKDIINNVAKLIPELAKVETVLAKTILKEIGEVVKDSANDIKTEADGFLKIAYASTLEIRIAIINALKVTIFKASQKLLADQRYLEENLIKISDKVNVSPLIESLSKINLDLNKAIIVVKDAILFPSGPGPVITFPFPVEPGPVIPPVTKGGVPSGPGPVILPIRSIFTGVITVIGSYSTVLLFVKAKLETGSGFYSFFDLKLNSIEPGLNDNEDVISFSVESRYIFHENLVPFRKFIYGSVNDHKKRGLKIVSVEVEDESPEVEAYLQHQSAFNAILQSK